MTMNTMLASDQDKLPRQELNLLFTLFTTTLIGAVSRTGGIRLANQFEQQLARYMRQNGWAVLSELDAAAKTLDLDDATLLTAYRSTTRHAIAIATQILGERVVSAALEELAANLTPHLLKIKEHYKVFGAP